MITDLYDIKRNRKEIAEIIIKEIQYLLEAKNVNELEKINIKFRIEFINPYR